MLKIIGKTILENIVSNFDIKNDEFLFICNPEGFNKYNFDIIFKKININYKVIKIDNHKKGPVYTLYKAKDFISLDSPIIVNYCDFYWKWNYENFKNKIINYDGSIVCYKGFHPHLLHPNLYAGVKTNGKNELIKIKEKFSYTNDKMQTWQSSGTYYFGKGEILKNYLDSFEKIKEQLYCNGEYYVSLFYNLLQKDNLKTIIYEIPYFLQLGTPGDYEEYKYWESIFNSKD